MLPGDFPVIDVAIGATHDNDCVHSVAVFLLTSDGRVRFTFCGFFFRISESLFIQVSWGKMRKYGLGKVYCEGER